MTPTRSGVHYWRRHEVQVHLLLNALQQHAAEKTSLSDTIDPRNQPSVKTGQHQSEAIPIIDEDDQGRGNRRKRA